MPSNKVHVSLLLAAFGALGAGAVGASACSSSSSEPPADAGPSDGGRPSVGAPGSGCADAGECLSGLCGGGHCCAKACEFDPNFPECVSCDSDGACQYPTGQCIAPVGCSVGSSQFLGAAYCAAGSCGTPQVQECAPYVCSLTGCQTSCSDDTSCATGSFCLLGSSSPDGGLEGVCTLRSAGGGYCGHADECQSGLCLKNVCCAAACSVDPNNPECSECDPQTGACLYPATVCRPGGCDAENEFSRPTVCAQGTCPSASPVACNAYQCTGQGCNTECLTDKDCAASALCQYPTEGEPNAPASGLQQGICCPRFETGKPIYVDVATGDDNTCCGADRAHPCQTLIRVTTLWNADLQSGDRSAETIELELTVDGGPGTWNDPPQYNALSTELLSNGMTVHAPGITFPKGITVGPTVMTWGPYSVTQNFQTTNYIGVVPGTVPPFSPATLKGDPGNPLTALVTVTGQVFPIPSPTLLNLTNAVGGANVAANAQVTLGVDEQGNAGTVSGPYSVNGDNYADTVCNWNALRASAGQNNYALYYAQCFDQDWMFQNLQTCVPATLIDSGDAGSALVGGLVSAGDCAIVNLARAPQVGSTDDAGSSGAQGSITTGVLAFNRAQVHLANGTVAGTTQFGVVAAPSSGPCVSPPGYPPVVTCLDGGVDPLVTLDNMAIESNGCFGVLAQEGEIFLNQTSVFGNYFGVVQGYVFSAGGGNGAETVGTVDLAHLPDGGPSAGNQVYCNSVTYHSAACPNYKWFQPGVDVWNQTPGPLFADRVAWSQVPPPEWTCDPNVDPASCRDGSGKPYTGGALNRVQTQDGFGVAAGPISAGLASQVSQAVCP